MDKFDAALGPVSRAEALEIGPVALAYIGDTVYDLYVRSYVVKNRMGRIDRLHRLSVSAVNAAAQAKALAAVADMLTEDEGYVVKLGRNSKTGTAPKHMELADYKRATGLECLVGFLYLTGQAGRLAEIFRVIIERTMEEDDSGKEA